MCFILKVKLQLLTAICKKVNYNFANFFSCLLLSRYNKGALQFVPYKTHLFCVFFAVFLLISLTGSNHACAQLNNTSLQQTVVVKPENANEIRIGIHLLGFNKNNEYFNNIADGYTLFGYHLMPHITYNYGGLLQLEAGALLWKDFGDPGFYSIQPTLTAKIQQNNWALIFGTLEGNLNHGYIEPLYDFERILNDRLENGMQFLYNTEKVKLDAWIDWDKMIYNYDPDREVINGGASIALEVLKKGGWEGDTTSITLPFQFTAQHKGGQIDTSDLSLITVVNMAVGVEVEKKLPFEVLTRVYTKNYLLGYKDFSNEFQFPYKEGYGVYLNVGIDTKYQDVMLSYWHGNSYITELGGKLYQSASTTVTTPDFLQEERRLLILRFMKDIHLLPDLNLTLRLEPVLDLDNPKLEFSNSFYLTFDTDFFVAKPRR